MEAPMAIQGRPRNGVFAANNAVLFIKPIELVMEDQGFLNSTEEGRKRSRDPEEMISRYV
jgi:hypothetical protein